MRIALNALALNVASYGMGSYIRQLVRNLSATSPDDRFVVYAPKHTAHHLLPGLGANVEIRKSLSNRPLRILWEQTGLPVDLKRRKIQVFHGLGAVNALASPCPQAMTIHDMTYFLFPHAHILAKALYFQKMIPLCVRRCELVIAVSENTKKDIVDILGVRPERVRVIHHGKDDSFNPIRDPAREALLRARYSLKRGIILFGGLVEPRKNLVTLLEAFAGLKALHRDYCLVVAGGAGWHYHRVLEKMAKLDIVDHVRFLDHVSQQDLADLYRMAEVFVYPSLYEGFGLPVLEAMACGTPVITSNVSSLPEIAGGAASLIDPNDSGQLAAALSRILGDQDIQAEMRQRGLAQSCHFSWERTARETRQVYEDLGR